MRHVAKHTPGPWHNSSKNYGYDKRHVCGPKHPDGSDWVPICTANTIENATLIAAAPELLESLRSVMTLFQFAAMTDARRAEVMDNIELSVWNRAQDAIAKAEGRHEA